MSIKDQTDKELADVGRMLAAQVSEIVAELTHRGLEANMQGYYGRRGDGIRYEFEVKRVTTENI